MIWHILFGVFLILHGLVHLLYLLHSKRVFQLPDLNWPDDSKIFKQVISTKARRMLAVILLGISCLGFVIGGIGTLLNFFWVNDWLRASIVISSFVFLIFWDGSGKKLDQQGLIALLINLGILIVLTL
ncbi:MAG: hypothetical protein CL609_21595 [Anaerolineaceae bacterium]|nr:hypothetical protein [Anaerolineaceae bacterium]